MTQNSVLRDKRIVAGDAFCRAARLISIALDLRRRAPPRAAARIRRRYSSDQNRWRLVFEAGQDVFTQAGVGAGRDDDVDLGPQRPGGARRYGQPPMAAAASPPAARAARTGPAAAPSHRRRPTAGRHGRRRSCWRANAGAPARRRAAPDSACNESEPAAGLPVVAGGIALGMTECQTVQRAGTPSNVAISAGEKGERKVVLTYLSGPWPGIYTFAVRPAESR